MPDIAVVLGNGAIRGEHASLGNVHKALTPPARGVAGVIAERLSLAHNVGVEVRQGLEPVLMDQLIMQAASISGPVRKLMARRMLASPSTHWAGS